MKLTLTRTYARRSDPSVATLTVEVAAADRAELEAMLAASGGRLAMRLRRELPRDVAVPRVPRKLMRGEPR